MRVVVQRVSNASVSVDGEMVAAIGPGLCLLVGVAVGDGSEDVSAVVEKIVGLRVFPDEAQKMNLSLAEAGGEVLVVSQFTLLGDLRRGRRPSFTGAAPPELAAPLIDEMVDGLRKRGVSASQGRFGAHMEVGLVNDGPVTLVIEVRQGSIV
ncbi:MAG: D-aminoacyl-tRNA deacylase [Acidimicrobiia bacterium]